MEGAEDARQPWAEMCPSPLTVWGAALGSEEGPEQPVSTWLNMAMYRQTAWQFRNRELFPSTAEEPANAAY